MVQIKRKFIEKLCLPEHEFGAKVFAQGNLNEIVSVASVEAFI